MQVERGLKRVVANWTGGFHAMLLSKCHCAVTRRVPVCNRRGRSQPGFLERLPAVRVFFFFFSKFSRIGVTPLCSGPMIGMAEYFLCRAEKNESVQCKENLIIDRWFTQSASEVLPYYLSEVFPVGFLPNSEDTIYYALDYYSYELTRHTTEYIKCIECMNNESLGDLRSSKSSQ